MKSASVALASLLFGSLAVAAPFDRRDLKTKTNLVTETVIVYTTVWEDEDPAPTSVDGLFYEQPPTTVITATEAPPAPAAPTSTPAAAPAPAAQPETTQAPAAAPAAPAPEPVTSAAPAPAAQPESQAPQQQQDTQPASQPSSQPASQPASSSSGSSSSGGATYTDVDITIYDNNGGYGACGTELHDSDMIVALAQSAWGSSTYDVMTGAATNPWCGQKIKIDYNGNSIEATIMDMCPGCSGHDIDLSLSAWKALTGMDEKTRLKASWSKA